MSELSSFTSKRGPNQLPFTVVASFNGKQLPWANACNYKGDRLFKNSDVREKMIVTNISNSNVAHSGHCSREAPIATCILFLMRMHCCSKPCMNKFSYFDHKNSCVMSILHTSYHDDTLSNSAAFSIGLS